MWYFNFMSELISEHLFDEFRSSRWPKEFSAMAQAASTDGKAFDELDSYIVDEVGLFITPREELRILEAMGIIEYRILHKTDITPGMVKNMPVGILFSDFISQSQDWVPRFSEFGKQVVTACENLYSYEDHHADDEAAKARLEQLIAAGNAELGL
jgi:hypothetical protein